MGKLDVPGMVSIREPGMSDPNRSQEPVNPVLVIIGSALVVGILGAAALYLAAHGSDLTEPTPTPVLQHHLEGLLAPHNFASLDWSAVANAAVAGAHSIGNAVCAITNSIPIL